MANTETQQPGGPPRRWLNKRDVLVALIGPGLILVLFLVYLASPGTWVRGIDKTGEPSLMLFDSEAELLPGAELGLYLRYVVEESHREYQLVEMITFGCSSLAGVLGLWATWLVLRRSFTLPKDGLGPLARFAAPAVLGTTALAAVFFAGEEVNWGQTFMRWGHSEFVTAEVDGEQYTAQSVHNTLDSAISVQSLGAGYLFVVLVVLPVLWRWREAWNLPARWAPAVAAWPAAFAVIYSYIVKNCKDGYLWLFAGESPKLDPMYMGYYEQMNEQKEMLMALALLLYAGYALARARGERGGPAAMNGDQAG